LFLASREVTSYAPSAPVCHHGGSGPAVIASKPLWRVAAHYSAKAKSPLPMNSTGKFSALTIDEFTTVIFVCLIRAYLKNFKLSIIAEIKNVEEIAMV
jgi:hypothetical protein